MLRSPLHVVALWLLSFCLVATFIGFAMDVPHLVLLKRERAETLGEVTRLHPENHGVVEVDYIVAGASYHRTFFPYLDYQGRLISKGESVRVFYSPRDPTIAFVAPPEEILTGDLPFWIMGSLLGSAGITAGVLVLWRKVAPIAKAVLSRQGQ